MITARLLVGDCDDCGELKHRLNTSHMRRKYTTRRERRSETGTPEREVSALAETRRRSVSGSGSGLGEAGNESISGTKDWMEGASNSRSSLTVGRRTHVILSSVSKIRQSHSKPLPLFAIWAVNNSACCTHYIDQRSQREQRRAQHCFCLLWSSCCPVVWMGAGGFPEGCVKYSEVSSTG